LCWEYRRFPTQAEAREFRDSLIAAGVPGEVVEIHVVSGREKSHLSASEALADLYGFRKHLIRDKDRASRRLGPGVVFDRAAIGEARYNAAMVGVSKAMRGLCVRGLASTGKFNCGYLSYEQTGIVLSRDGIEEAECIKAKNPAIVTDISFYADTPARPTETGTAGNGYQDAQEPARTIGGVEE
jgi:hypothetical protein